MSTSNHTDIGTGAAVNASVVNSPLGELDAAIGNLTTLNTTPKTSVVGAIGTSTPTTTAKTLTGAINELDADLAAVSGGASVTDARLKEWTEGECYEPTAVTWDGDGVVSSATVKWPDGSAGTFTTTSKNSTWLAIDAYTISHTVSGKTVTQAAVTRDGNGNITVKPALSVA